MTVLTSPTEKDENMRLNKSTITEGEFTDGHKSNMARKKPNAEKSNSRSENTVALGT
jgi:hypothetical protein